MRGLARAFCEEVRDSMGCAAVAVRRLRNDGSAPHLANLGFPLAYVEREGELTSDKGCGCAMVLGGCTDPDDPAFSRGGSYTYSEDGEFPDEATESWYRRCRASCIQTGFATMATVPIRIGNRILGLVQAASHEVAGIPHDSLAVLEDSALQLGVAMQRIKAEKQLQAQVRFQQEVLDAIPIPVYYKDVSGRMLGWNRAWLRSTGWKPGEVRGRTAGEVLPPSLAAKFDQMDRDLLGNPGRQVFDHRFQDASGQVRETVIHRATFSGSNEDTGGIIGAIVDVTALKQATTALQEMNTNLEGKVQERLQELQTLYRLSRELVHAHSLHELARTVLHYLHGPLPAELSALAIGVGDRCLLFHRCDRPLADPVVHTVNQRLSRELERLGVPKCPAIEHWAEPTIPAPRDAPPLAQLGSNYLVPLQSEGRSRYLGVLLVACESDQSLTENHVRLLHVAAAQAADAAFRLLSKPRATELAMAVPSTDEDPLETPLHDARPLLDRIHWLAILLDAQHRILYVNDPAMALMDTQREAMVGVPIHRCPSSWDWARLEEAMLPAALVTGSSRVPDLRYTTSDGRTGVLDVRIVSLAKDATPGPLVLLAEDVTQRRDLEARLVMARKMESVGQLAAGIAHEINTPTQYVGDNLQFLGEAFQDMADLFGSIEALLDDPGDDVLPPAHRQRLELARESADLEYLREEIPLAVTQAHEGIERISAIVRSMRDFSHKGSQEKRVADLNRCIQGTVTVARSEWKYVARVVQDLDTDLPSVPTLAAELNQVLLNLLINSAQAIAETERGESSGLGTITIRSERRAGEIELSVTDDGCGIPFELQRRVFVPFFTTKRAGRGTGQGLAISRSIVVDKLGGRLDFESTPGIGTTFTIHLPIET